MPRLVILGSASAVADADHENTHMILQGSHSAILIDCTGRPLVDLQRIGVGLDDLTDMILTHFHPDHSGDNHRIKDLYPLVKIVISKAADTSIGIKGDVTISDGDQIKLGEITLDFILTPGHTPDGLCIVVDDEVLVTGDTLFIGDCGRTDLQGGDLGQMYKTLNEKIKTLPDHLIVYPGHDYGDKPFDTLGHQKQTNKTLLARNIMELSKIP